MICPRCFGKHVEAVGGALVPCPECGGLGEIHCCEGLREQEEGSHGDAQDSDKQSEHGN